MYLVVKFKELLKRKLGLAENNETSVRSKGFFLYISEKILVYALMVSIVQFLTKFILSFQKIFPKVLRRHFISCNSTS